MSHPQLRFQYRAAQMPLGHRANFGLMVLQTDETLEQDLRRLVPVDGVALHISRIANATDISPDSLGAMAAGITASAALLPESPAYDCIGYGCTSASSVIGNAQVDRLLKAGRACKASATPLSGLIQACQALGVQRLALVTPYMPAVNEAMITAIERDGIDISAEGSFCEGDDRKVAQLEPAALAKAARQTAAAAACDAIFLSCTNLRTLDIIAPLEAELGIPVLSSNLVLIWAMLRAANLAPQHPLGRLLAQHLGPDMTEIGQTKPAA